MPGDPFKKALPGQRLVIPADAFNGFVDAANYVRARRHNTESDVADEFRQTGIVRVRNNTGFALPRFGVLALSEPIISPLANLQEFKNKVNFEGGTPYEPIAAGRFAVLLESLDVNGSSISEAQNQRLESHSSALHHTLCRRSALAC